MTSTCPRKYWKSIPLEAAAQLDEDKPDLLFLDINMPDLDGISFIPMLIPKPMIILTMAYDQYALKAFELEVKDYLVRPFSSEGSIKRTAIVPGSRKPAATGKEGS